MRSLPTGLLRKNMEKNKGVIFNIQRFSTHDGPGIRTTVFLKGCPLRCWWCSNPESQSGRPQLMVRDIKCAGCLKCMDACPESAIIMTGDGVRIINWDVCTQCLKCVEACLYESLCTAGRMEDVDSILEEVIRDEVFYRNSGGGVTVSGGEPMTQADFLVSLLKGLKGQGLHVALDTTGYAPWEKYELVLPMVDLVLFDIKHFDPARHLEYTGLDNRLILENGKKIAGRVKTWLRMPLIPGINDSEEMIAALADTALDWDVEKVSILPYHEGGRSKAEQAGMKYPMPEVTPPDDDRLEEITNMMAKAGVTVSVRH